MYELGADSGKNYSVNVPLKEGMDDQSKYHNLCICLCRVYILLCGWVIFILNVAFLVLLPYIFL